MLELRIDQSRVWCGTGGVEWQDHQPLLLFLHGAGQNHSVWALQARALAQQGWNVAAPDLPGHGQSENDAGLDSISAYAGWLQRLVDSLDVEHLALVGHSMGACIALTFAASQPEKVKALVLIGAGEALPVNRSLLDDTLHTPLRAHRFITAFGHGRGAHFGGAEAPGIWMLGSSLALLEHCEPAILHRDFAACNDWQGGAIAEQIRCPALVLSGAGDRMTPPKAGRALAAKIPQATFELVARSGHMMMSEVPGRVTAALQLFLNPKRACIGSDGALAEARG